MNYLVDTHYLIWSLLYPERIEPGTLEVLSDPLKVKYVSKITLWEISLKYSLGKLQLEGLTAERFLHVSVSAGYEIFDVSTEDLIGYYRLPKHKNHRDPFERLLVWQCIRNGFVLLTADKRIRDYSKYGLKLLTES